MPASRAAPPDRPQRAGRPTVATTNDLKNGLLLNFDGQLWTVVEFQHVKPGKGGAFVRTKLKNVLTGKVVDRTFNAGVKEETANVDKRDMQYLYKDCLFYTSDAADEEDSVDLGGRRIIKKKKKKKQ